MRLRNSGDRRWVACTVGVRDLIQDGANQIPVGTQTMELRLYDAAQHESVTALSSWAWSPVRGS